MIKAIDQGIIPRGPICIRLKHKPDCYGIVRYCGKAYLRVYYFKLFPEYELELTRTLKVVSKARTFFTNCIE